MSKRECTEAEREFLEACYEGWGDHCPEPVAREDRAYIALKAERQPKDPFEVFNEDVKRVLESDDGRVAMRAHLFAALAKLDAARKEKP